MLFVEGRILSKLTGREILFSISYCNDYYTISSDLNIGIIKLHLALPATAPHTDTEIRRYRDTVRFQTPYWRLDQFHLPQPATSGGQRREVAHHHLLRDNRFQNCYLAADIDSHIDVDW